MYCQYVVIFLINISFKGFGPSLYIYKHWPHKDVPIHCLVARCMVSIYLRSKLTLAHILVVLVPHNTGLDMHNDKQRSKARPGRIDENKAKVQQDK